MRNRFQKSVKLVVYLFSSVIVMSAYKGICNGGGEPPTQPTGPGQIYCEIDAMAGFSPTINFFYEELKIANQNRGFFWRLDNDTCFPNPQYLRGDIIPDELENYLTQHRSIVDTLTMYDNRVYLCGVRCIVIPTMNSPHDSSAVGVTYFIFADTTVHNEGKSAIAVETIRDSCGVHLKPYGNHMNWAVAHELGHQMNLPYPNDHCPRSDCMMWFSWSAYGAYKSTFCDSCRSRLSWSHP